MGNKKKIARQEFLIRCEWGDHSLLRELIDQNTENVSPKGSRDLEVPVFTSLTAPRTIDTSVPYMYEDYQIKT